MWARNSARPVAVSRAAWDAPHTTASIRRCRYIVSPSLSQNSHHDAFVTRLPAPEHVSHPKRAVIPFAVIPSTRLSNCERPRDI